MIIVESTVYLSNVEVESIVNLMKIDVEVETLFPVIIGKSAYRSYLTTTSDIPPLSEEEWSSLFVNLKTDVQNLKSDIDILKNDPEKIQPYDSYLLFPNIGKVNILYLDKYENESYRWDDTLLKYFLINEIDIQIINGGE